MLSSCHRMLMLVVVLGVLAGCGAHRMPPVDARGAGSVTPQIEDVDAGLVGVAPGFAFKEYGTIVVEPFTVNKTEIKDDDDARLAKDMVAHLHAQLLRRFQGTGVKVIDATVSQAAVDARTLRLQGEITKLTEGSQAVRYFVGFGAGAAKAQIETRFVDIGSGTTGLVTADRRAAGMGIFGGDGRQFVTESIDQMAEGLGKLVQRLAAGGQPGK